MKQNILIVFNFFKLFLSSLKSQSERLDPNYIKNLLKQKFKLWEFTIILVASLLTGILLANIETKIQNKSIVLDMMLNLTFKPLEWILSSLLILLIISPICLRNDKTRDFGDWVGYKLEIMFKKFNLVTCIYIAAFIVVAFDSYLVSIFILLSAKCYLSLVMLIILLNCTFFTLFFELIFFAILILELISFISDRISHNYSYKSFAMEVV